MGSPRESRPTPPARAANGDLAFLAMDIGPVPEQFGAALVLDRGLDEHTVQRTIAARIGAQPQLRQRLVRTPPGCGRPIWVDDTGFDVGRHLRRATCRSPGDVDALVATALPFVLEPLPHDRPLWRAVTLDGLPDDRLALVLVVHHALSDGIGGLAILADLADGGQDGRPTTPFPRPAPSNRELAADAARQRLRSLLTVARTWWLFRSAMSAGGGLAPARAADTSLLAPTGPHRRAAVVKADLHRLREAAHRAGGTVNSALVSAVAGALHAVTAHRGENVRTFAVALPVTGRTAPGATLGNQVSPLLVNVRATGDVRERIADVADTVRRHRTSATGPPPIALLGPAFRLLAAAGGYRWYMNRQHRLHTVVSYVRGPTAPVRFAGVHVRTIIPLSVGGSSNLTITIQALSYGDTLTVTAVADPDRVPDLGVLTATLRTELDVVALL